MYQAHSLIDEDELKRLKEIERLYFTSGGFKA